MRDEAAYQGILYRAALDGAPIHLVVAAARRIGACLLSTVGHWRYGERWAISYDPTVGRVDVLRLKRPRCNVGGHPVARNARCDREAGHDDFHYQAPGTGSGYSVWLKWES